jgi:RNA polymerase sigma factor (sigma-70 family)
MALLHEIDPPPAVLTAAARGDPQACSELFTAVAPGLLGVIRRLVGSRGLAEDLLHDTLIAMFEHLGQFRGEAPFGTWVRRIAISRCLMSLRSPWQRARIRLESDQQLEQLMPGESAIGASDLIDLDRAMAQLAPSARAVVWLFEVEGWSHEEIARAFDRSVSFSKSQLARAHRRLRLQLSTQQRLPACTLP